MDPHLPDAPAVSFHQRGLAKLNSGSEFVLLDSKTVFATKGQLADTLDFASHRDSFLAWLLQNKSSHWPHIKGHTD